MEFTYFVADHCELVWATLDLHRSIEEVDVDESTVGPGQDPAPTPAQEAAPNPSAATKREPPAPAAQPPNKRTKKGELTVSAIGTLLQEKPQCLGGLHLKTLVQEQRWKEWADYFATQGCMLNREIFVSMAKIILMYDANWFQYGASSSVRHKLCQVADKAKKKEAATWLVLATCRYLSFLGFGVFVASAHCPAGGRPVWYYCRRPLVARKTDADALQPLLAELGFTDASTPSAGAYINSTKEKEKDDIPPRAPQIDAWEPLDAETLLIRGRALTLLPPAPVPEPSTAPTQLECAELLTPELVSAEDLAHLALVDVPRVGSCFYSCIHLARSSTEDIHAWKCTPRAQNMTAEDPVPCTHLDIRRSGSRSRSSRSRSRSRAVASSR